MSILYWETVHKSHSDKMKCPWCQSAIEPEDGDSDYLSFSCTKCRNVFRINTCEECGHNPCHCDTGFEYQEPCDGCKNTPVGAPRLLCQGGGCPN